MNIVDKNHSNNLREGLLALYHSGQNGFEGLLGIVLACVTGQSFRLAKSGTQRGRDGDTAFDGGATYFEGKRYRNSPKKAEISAKLIDLFIDDSGQVDLWILGAPCEVSAQTTTDLRELCSRMGIGAVLLDWSDNDLGALLVAVVTAGDKAKDFIENGLKGKAGACLIKGTLDAIDHFAKHPDLPARLEALRTALSAEESGLGQARSLNGEWLIEVLSSRVSARAVFGQPLAPLDASSLAAIARPLEAKLRNAFTGRPDGEIYAVVGDEGVGKSWLVASTWLACDSASILIICPAEDLLAPEATGDFESFLIGKLINQTGGQRSERASERWRRRIRGWRANPAPKNVRLTMVFDGLNQPLKADWSRRLDHAASELVKMGGCLVITTRSTHWTHLQNALASKIAHVPVAQWTLPEVESILHGRGIDTDKVKPEILQSLRNPRILGIAMDLLAAKDIELIDQLSVGRLMFEHLRKAQTTGAAPMSGLAFAELLKTLANETLMRTQKQENDDIRLFDTANHNGLQDVASSRFFVPIKGSAVQYEIRDDGLNLGLALCLIGALEKELRAKRDPRERLAAILEPISALDEAASVVFLATQVACLDEETSPLVISALLEHFVSLQNLPNEESEAFAVLVRSAAEPFLVAAQNVYSSNTSIPNSEWLLYALRNHRDDPQVWAKISKAVKRWLDLYSLAPERMMFKSAGRDLEEEVNTERENRQQDIDKKLAALTHAEQLYLEANLVSTDQWRFGSLHRTAFYLLAGKPLVEFADNLVGWGFSNSLGPAIHGPVEEFKQLIRFNNVDWNETRAALLAKIEIFKEDKSSTVGKWTTVGIQRATGDIDDAKRADELADWLTRDREKFSGWSLVENYCSNDPCDPGSTKPENVDATAKSYRAIDPTKLSIHMGLGTEGHYFKMARTGIVRFHVDDAVFAHRALADDVLTRTGFSRRQGVLALLEHSAVLTKEQAKGLLAAGQTSSVTHSDKCEHRDEWLTAQYSVFIALPHLPADEQLEVVAGIRGSTILLDLLNALLPASEETTERVLECVFQTGDEEYQGSVLGALSYSQAPLSTRSLAIVSQLIKSSNALVRAQALGVAAANTDKSLLKVVVSSGWDAGLLRLGKQTYERWSGSAAILEAANAGLIDIDAALDRLDLRYYGFAAQVLGPDGAKAIAQRVIAALVTALNYAQMPDLPEMTMPTPHASDLTPPLMTLNDRSLSPESGNRLGRLGETEEQFDTRQAELGRSFERFTKGLTKADAELVLADMTLGGMKVLIEADPNSGRSLLEMLSSASDRQLCNLHHVAMQVAVVLSGESSVDKLLHRLAGLSPTINRVEGLAKVPAESLALWRNADAAKLRTICKRRLLTRRKDREIAFEVVAAYIGGQEAIIEEVIEELLATGQPMHICLALTIAGFTDQNAHVENIIARFEGAHGFIGIARQAASDVYQRNIWARKWYERMLAAKAPLDFWQSSVLLTKIVDARFDVWAGSSGAGTGIFRAFSPTIYQGVKRRIEKCQKKRKDLLFGDKTPAELFLQRELY
ncbi:MAG: hypothetical protein DRR42_16240 [Gammaproteobacteria bacterium]|nr:MAG: hypothetical protein DRR42_16240 [Gammaproteobacteria bacterium]